MPSKKRNVLEKLSENGKSSIRFAAVIAKAQFSKVVRPDHLFFAIALNKRSLGARTLQVLGVDISSLVEEFLSQKEFKIEDSVKSETEVALSKEVKEILREAYSLANKLSHVYVGTEHILLALLSQKKLDFTKVLVERGINYKLFEEALLNYATYPMGILTKPENIHFQNIMEDQSILSAIGYDLVESATEGKLDPVLGRDLEIEKMLNILSRRKKNNVVIVGEAGVGKTALVEGLAQRINDGNVPKSLRGAKIISLDISSIIAGSKMRGDVEEKMMDIVDEVTSSPDTILFIDEIHSILAPSSPGNGSEIASILKPALVRDDFRCIGATTTSEYTQYFEEDNALARRFQPVMLEETSVVDTMKILKKIKPILEGHHRVKISTEAIELAVKLSDRYVSDRYLPDKAIDLLDEASATRKLEVELKHKDIVEVMDKIKSINLEKESSIKKGKMEEAKEMRDEVENLEKNLEKMEKSQEITQKSKEFEVDIDTIRSVVSKWTGIPVSTLGDKEVTNLGKLEKILAKNVVGQTDAVDVVASAIKRARTGISSADRPWASFLFLGPTGVGKTELAKVLTKELFGEENRLIQIDMSELMEMHSVSKLIGSPPGYVGYREGGQLTEQVRRHPHSVILFDELEKAHDDVLNILLQILEYGHLTDGKGRRVNFKNTIIILTSNIGAEEIRKDRVLGFSTEERTAERSDKEIDKAYDSMKDDLLRKLKEKLRPELINRLDDIVIFRALTRKDARKIVDLLVRELNQRLLDQNVKADVSKEVREWIVEEGFSDEYGARPLRRTLQDNVENALANHMLSNDMKGRKKILKVGLRDKKIIVNE